MLLTNPELVKTGLDLLEFPTIVFMQSGWNVYTLQQASRRSWRIGQKLAVKVIYLGYAATSQMTCLSLMAKKILVSQSTSGDVPESGLDALQHGWRFRRSGDGKATCRRLIQLMPASHRVAGLLVSSTLQSCPRSSWA